MYSAGIKELCGTVLRHGSLETSEQMVQYNYEPVQGDQVICGINTGCLILN